MKYVVSIAYRMDDVNMSVYRPHAAFVATESGIEVFPLDGDALAAARASEQVLALLATMSPVEVLEYLYERNSTVTSYAQPGKVTAESPEQAAALHFDRESRK